MSANGIPWVGRDAPSMSPPHRLHGSLPAAPPECGAVLERVQALPLRFDPAGRGACGGLDSLCARRHRPSRRR